MSYTSADAVKARFAQVPGVPWGTGKFPDDDSLAQIIAAADALIDDYCRDWYAVPFSPDTPETIADISLALAVAEVRKVIFSDGPVPDQRMPSRAARPSPCWEGPAAAGLPSRKGGVHRRVRRRCE